MAKSGGLSQHIAHFESLIAADREVLKQLWREVESLDSELKALQDSNRQLGNQVNDQRREEDSLVEEQRLLVARLQTTKEHLGSICDDRRAVNLEALSLRHDREHFQEELVFLQQTAEEEGQMFEVISRANDFLQKSVCELTSETEVLERERRELLQQMASERELNRVQERETAQLRCMLERMRREQATRSERHREASAKEQRIQDLKANGPRWPAAVTAQSARQREVNTWAACLTRMDSADSAALGGPSSAASRSGAGSTRLLTARGHV
mmetsp:Transcript_85979/g.199917  ORF Transcript_85979/g.199917 Transcript_85979/m.199917 type:complete len:270 (+) Transcript_85979:47-856(+)